MKRPDPKAVALSLARGVGASLEKPAARSGMGINVRSDLKSGIRYADEIVDGNKKYETRDSDSLRPYVNKRMAIVRTGEGPAVAIGEAIIGEPIVADRKLFHQLRDQHLVPEGSTFDIKPNSKKYLYPIIDPRRFDTEKSVGTGIVARKVIEKAAGGPAGNTLLDSTGKPVHHTPEGVEAFKRWHEGSKVVDDQGRPLVVYHGSIRHADTDTVKNMGDIYEFDRLFSTKFRRPSVDTMGSWFSTNPGERGAEMYSGSGAGSVIYPVYLSIKNPHETTFRMMERRARLLANGEDDGRKLGEPEVNAYRQWLSDMGKDGVKIVHDEGSERGSTEFKDQDAWIALEPGQIKSATGNDGTFDHPTDITRAKGGEVLSPEEHEKNLSRFMEGVHPLVPRVLHTGTTGDFTAFDPRRANIESNLGAGIYASNSKEDIAANYAGEGPDLTNRIERKVDEFRDSDVEYTEDELRDIARNELNVHHKGLTMPIHMALKNPVVLGGPHETFYDYSQPYDEERDEYGEPQGAGAKLHEAFQAAANEFDVHPDEISETGQKLFEHMADHDGIKASDVEHIIKNGMVYAMDPDTGDSATSEILRKTFENLGHDGIVDTTVNRKFGTMKVGFGNAKVPGMTGVTPDTIHYVAFKPTQIKSALGNRGTFDPEDPDITKAEGGEVESTLLDSTGKPVHHTPEGVEAFKRWFGDSKAVNELGQPRRVYHGTAGDFSSFDINRAGQTYGLKDEKAFFFTGRLPVAESAAEDATGLPFYKSKYEYKGFGGGHEVDRSYDYYDDVAPRDNTVDTHGGQNIMPVYLSMQKPMILDADEGYGAGSWLERRGEKLGDLIARAKEEGHDGIIVRGKYRNWEAIGRIRNSDRLSEEDKKEWLDRIAREDARKQQTDHYFIVFRPHQIKSAIGNDGTYDHPTDITKANGGQVDEHGIAAPEPFDIDAAKEKYLEDNTAINQRPIEGHDERMLFHFTKDDSDEADFWHEDPAESTEQYREFDTNRSELGIHLGSRDQAEGRMSAYDIESGLAPRTLPVYASIKKPIRLQDTGNFDWHSVLPQLEAKGVMSFKEAEQFLKDMHPLFEEYGATGEEVTKAGNEDMRRFLKSKGFDGVVYLNRVEGVTKPGKGKSMPTSEAYLDPDLPDDEFRKAYPDAHDSYIIFDPTQAKSAFAREYNPKESELSRAEGGAAETGLEGMELHALNPGHAEEYIRAYHGTPHSFDAFDASKIGSGEGAQAYGYGIYVAESPDVAKTYAMNLSNRDMANQGRLNAHANAKRSVALAGDPRYVADDIKFVLGNEPDHPQKKLLQDTLWFLESGEYEKPLENSGNLYKVDLPKDMAESMADWDKPLSEQPAKVQEVLRYTDLTGTAGYIARTPEKTTFGDLHDALKNQISPRQIAEYFRGAGIPGISYFDAGSRGSRSGTRNFVVFPGEEHRLKIRKAGGGSAGSNVKPFKRKIPVADVKAALRVARKARGLQ